MTDSLVIIPTYNEKENIEPLIDKIMLLPKGFDVLVVDDNSPDGTAKIVRAMQIKFPNRVFIIEREKKLGLGTAYITGFKWALQREYEYIFGMDADFSHNPEDLISLYDACANNGADVAIGSRYKTGVNVINWPIGRVLTSYFASKYVCFITGMKIHDTTSGFMCYGRHVLQTINLDKVKFKGYAFLIEMKFTAWKIGFKVEEVPIIFTERRRGKSKISGGIIREAFFGVIRLKLESFFKKYPVANLKK